MRKILFLTLYDEQGASTRQRILQYLPIIENSGFTSQIEPLISSKANLLFLKLAKVKNAVDLFKILLEILCLYPKRLKIIWKAKQYDIVVVQKDVLPFGLSLLLKMRNPKILVEFDDPIWLKNPGAGGNIPFFGNLITKIRTYYLVQLLKRATAVTVDNPKMVTWSQKYCLNSFWIPPGVVMEPLQNLLTKNIDEKYIIHIGSPSTTYLLKNLLPQLEKLALIEPFTLVNIGGTELFSTEMKILNIPWSKENEKEWLTKACFGLMPTDNAPFNLHRFSLKSFVYARGQITTLAADTELNRVSIEDGISGLIYQPENFIEKALYLLRNPKICSEMGVQAWKKVSLENSIPQVATHWVKLLQAL